MNSEELEISLRTEFESYLKGIFAEMRQEVSQFQEKLDAELERHKSELDGVFSSILSKVENTQELDASFKDTVIEHLRLAKDEGAMITATAIAQAEEMEKDSAPAVGIKEIHEAVNDISSKQSQSEILKSLVQHAGQFAPRGAFFIIKNEHLVGWRVFGGENASTDEKVREVFLPTSADSILSQAVNSLETARAGNYADDAEVFNKLDFGSSQNPVAVPLVARGRGVAVLYADHGSQGGEVNAEALEMLVRVAGLTVEVLASAKSAASKPVRKFAPAVEESSAPAAFIATPTEQQFSQPEQFVQTNDQTNEEAHVPDEYQPTEAAQPEQFNDYQTPAVESASEQTEESFGDEYQTPVVENTPEQISESSYEEINPQPFYDREPSLAPSVQESAAAEEFPADSEKTDFYHPETAQSEETQPTDVYEVEGNHSPNAYEIEPVTSQTEFRDYESSASPETEKYPAYNEAAWAEPVETQNYSAQEYAENFAKETDPTEYAKDYSNQAEESRTEEAFYKTSEDLNDSAAGVNDYQYETPKQESYDNYELPPSASLSAPPAESFMPAAEQSYDSFEPQIEEQETPVQSYEPVVSPPVQSETPKTRLSERNVDLPIEVSEDERRLHNDARRFARLLVSEIKLYNEQKVKEGRDSNDLYDRLREAIDRSREMYDKRVQPPVAAKFDYFHYELVNTLAEGDANKLGTGYPGATA